jgi:hypothetical protein
MNSPVRPVDPEKLHAQLRKLSKTHHVICMNAVVYSACRSFGREQLLLAPASQTPDALLFSAFTSVLGIQSVFFQAAKSAPADEEYDIHYSQSDLIRKGYVDWALLVVADLPADQLRVAVQMGEPWQDIPLEA